MKKGASKAATRCGAVAASMQKPPNKAMKQMKEMSMKKKGK